MLDRYKPRRLAVLSRDELKQYEMRQKFPEVPGGPMRYFLGDVRDYDRLRRAFQGVDVVIHTAALKQVPAAEADPFEAVQTNIMGSKNVIDAAIDTGVDRAIILSTDKAVNPVNLYGGTKLVAEKLFTQGNAYSGMGGTRFSCSRYGNVVGSRGSVLPLFLEQRKSGVLTITDPRMTRFWVSLDQGVEFVIRCIERMSGGEVFVPKIPSMKITELAETIAPECRIELLGIRPGEKLHEVLISEDEASRTVEFDDYFVIMPSFANWTTEYQTGGRPVPERFEYTSDKNLQQMDRDEMMAIVESL